MPLPRHGRLGPSAKCKPFKVMPLGLLFLLCLLFSPCSVKSKSSADEIPIAMAHEVKNWAMHFGKDIKDGSSEATCLRKITENYNEVLKAKVEYVDATKMVEEMKSDVQYMLDWKKSSVERIAKEAEKLAANHTFDKRLKFTYNNAKRLYDPRTQVPRDTLKVWTPMELSEHPNFDNVKVNIYHSAIQVPINVYDESAEVVNDIKWSEGLTQVFKNNLAFDPHLSWQFFGSNTGFLRAWPAAKWRIPVFIKRENPTAQQILQDELDALDLYDARMRNWFINAAASPKDIIILLDGSGSMTGQRKEIAKNVVLNILETLTDNDYFTIVRFTNTIQYIVECFGNDLVQANKQNIREFKEKLDTLNTTEIANFTVALTHAFQTLKDFTNAKQGSNCNQAIMLVTDGAPETYEDIFKEQNWPRINIRVFTFLVGREVTETKEVNWMACHNRGYYTHIANLAEVREQVQLYIPVMSRPLVLAGKRPVTWTPVYADITEVPLTNWIWEERQREKIRSAIRAKIEQRIQREANQDQYYESIVQGSDSKEGLEASTAEEEDIDKGEADYEEMLERSQNASSSSSASWTLKAKRAAGKGGGKSPKVTDGSSFDLGISAEEILAIHKRAKEKKKTVHLMTTVAMPVFDTKNFTNITVRVLVKNVWHEEQREIRTANLLGVAGIDVPIKEIVKLTPAYKVITGQGTPFTLAISLPEPYGHYRVIGQIEVMQKAEDYSQYFKGNNWRVHPNWVYCENPANTVSGISFQVPEEAIHAFLEDSAKGQEHIRWRQSSTRPPVYDKLSCEKDLVQSLVFDAKATNIDPKKCGPPKTPSKYERQITSTFGITLTFVSTRSGLTRFEDHRTEEEKSNSSSNGSERPFSEVHVKATDELFYRRAVDYHRINSTAWVFSVPFDAASRENVYVTASQAVFIGTGMQKAPAAVVGLQFKHQMFAERFFNHTTKCVTKECTVKCSDETTECFLLDNNGYIVVAEDDRFTGKFFGEYDDQLFDVLVKRKIYKKVHMYDYQAICIDTFQISGPAGFLLTPLDILRKAILWIWAKVSIAMVDMYINGASISWFPVSASDEDYSDDYQDRVEPEEPKRVINKTRPRPCDKEFDLYEMSADIDQSPNLPVTGKHKCSSSECDQTYIAQPVPYSNLLTLVVLNSCSCSSTTRKIDPIPVVYEGECEVTQRKLPRVRPEECISQHPEEVNIKICGKGFVRTPSSTIAALTVCSITFVFHVTFLRHF
ncbi:Voltage-dependent calcium channel subunit alpha-2/delta-3 [Halotydeus destructor]|nr:Voltage-dependent calcium channel subunit alpha-2/delta-3 [Halotydeus destructor]